MDYEKLLYNSSLITIRQRHIAILMHNKSPVAIGYNSTRMAYPGCEYGRHAEIDAVSKLSPKYRNKKLTLYSIRIGGKENLTSSKPCLQCWEYMRKYCKIKTIYYYDETGECKKVRGSKFLPTHISLRFRHDLRKLKQK